MGRFGSGSANPEGEPHGDPPVDTTRIGPVTAAAGADLAIVLVAGALTLGAMLSGDRARARAPGS